MVAHPAHLISSLRIFSKIGLRHDDFVTSVSNSKLAGSPGLSFKLNGSSARRNSLVTALALASVHPEHSVRLRALLRDLLADIQDCEDELGTYSATGV